MNADSKYDVTVSSILMSLEFEFWTKIFKYRLVLPHEKLIPSFRDGYPYSFRGSPAGSKEQRGHRAFSVIK